MNDREAPKILSDIAPCPHAAYVLVVLGQLDVLGIWHNRPRRSP